MQGGIMVGARWEDASQNARFSCARSLGLLDYAEVHYPVSPAHNPGAMGLKILAHASSNALCSAHGIDMEVAQKVRAGALAANSPWVGEHLALLSPEGTCALGQAINPLFTEEFVAISVVNARQLAGLYGRPIALKLGPLYTHPKGDYRSEMHFLAEVALAANALIVLDLSHWTVSNKNLRRPPTFGFDHLPLERVVELQLAGWRKSPTQNLWHDAHEEPPGEEILALLAAVLPQLHQLKAVTLEQTMERSTEDFLLSLDKVHSVVEHHHGRRDSH